jgi:hypothetical protein
VFAQTPDVQRGNESRLQGFGTTLRASEWKYEETAGAKDQRQKGNTHKSNPKNKHFAQTHKGKRGGESKGSWKLLFVSASEWIYEWKKGTTRPS